jgi:hypothetical protein
LKSVGQARPARARTGPHGPPPSRAAPHTACVGFLPLWVCALKAPGCPLFKPRRAREGERTGLVRDDWVASCVMTGVHEGRAWLGRTDGGDEQTLGGLNPALLVHNPGGGEGSARVEWREGGWDGYAHGAFPWPP